MHKIITNLAHSFAPKTVVPTQVEATVDGRRFLFTGFANEKHSDLAFTKTPIVLKGLKKNKHTSASLS